eukprot:COSAG04_NODE_12669_length_640_cov_4.020333_1_plen_48_part_10
MGKLFRTFDLEDEAGGEPSVTVDQRGVLARLVSASPGTVLGRLGRLLP